jgi:hypothetical protein
MNRSGSTDSPVPVGSRSAGHDTITIVLMMWMFNNKFWEELTAYFHWYETDNTENETKLQENHSKVIPKTS